MWTILLTLPIITAKQGSARLKTAKLWFLCQAEIWSVVSQPASLICSARNRILLIYSPHLSVANTQTSVQNTLHNWLNEDKSNWFHIKTLNRTYQHQAPITIKSRQQQKTVFRQITSQPEHYIQLEYILLLFPTFEFFSTSSSCFFSFFLHVAPQETLCRTVQKGEILL